MLEKREAGTSVRSVWLWKVKMGSLLIQGVFFNWPPLLASK